MQSLRRLGGGCYLTTPPCPTLRWLAAQGPCRSSVGVYAVQDAGRRPRGRTRCASPGAEGQEPGFTTCRRADSTVFSASSYSQEKGTGEPAGSWPRRRSWTGVGVGSRLRRCRGRNHVSHCVGDESVRVEMYNECCFVEPRRQAPVASGTGQENHGRGGRTLNPKPKKSALNPPVAITSTRSRARSYGQRGSTGTSRYSICVRCIRACAGSCGYLS